VTDRRTALPWHIRAIAYMLSRVKNQVMTSGERQKVMQMAVRWPCGVCGKGVANNSIQCTSCQMWVYRKCSGINGSMYKMMK